MPTAEEMKASKKNKTRHLFGVILSALLAVLSMALINYISYAIKNKRTNALMVCAMIGLIADVFVVQLVKAAVSFALLMYLGKSTAAGGKQRRCMLNLLPGSLLEKLR